QAWELARGGTSQRVLVAGAPGLGKSRLIEAAVDRLRTRGARVIRLSARATERSIPFSFVADLAVALAGLPGAAAIAATSAGTLVRIAPQLASVFADAAA